MSSETCAGCGADVTNEPCTYLCETCETTRTEALAAQRAQWFGGKGLPSRTSAGVCDARSLDGHTCTLLRAPNTHVGPQAHEEREPHGTWKWKTGERATFEPDNAPLFEAQKEITRLRDELYAAKMEEATAARERDAALAGVKHGPRVDDDDEPGEDDDEAGRILRIGHAMATAGLTSYVDEDGRAFTRGVGGAGDGSK